MYRAATSKFIRSLKGRAVDRTLSRFASSSAVAAKSSSGGLFSIFGGSGSSSPPLDFPLKGIEIPPSLPDHVEPGKTKITTLPNGVKIASESSASPAASIGLYVNSGSIYETPATLGATHVLERMAFKSTLNRTHLRLVREVEAIGGNVTASASREQMGYTFDALKTYVPQMVELLVDCVRNQAFKDWEVNEQIQKVKAEIAEYANNPEALLLEAVHSAGYTGALANPLLASEGLLNRINSDVLEEFVAANYTAPRMVLAASGVEHEELLKYAEPLLADLPGGAPAVEPKSVYVGGDHRVMANTGSTSFALAFELPGGWLKEKEAMTLTVLHMLMGGGGSFSAGGPGKGMYSRLYLRVLNQYPEIQSFSAFNSVYNHTAIFGIQGTTSSGFVSNRCLSVNDCSILAYGPGNVIPSTLKIIKPNREFSISLNMSTSVEYGRVVLVTDKDFCKDAAGNQFTRTKASWFFVHFDRRDVYVDLRTRIPEQLLPLDNNVRLVQATNKPKNLKLYLYFTQPIVNTSAEVLKSITVSQGSLISATSNNDTLGNRRFGFQFVDIANVAIVTAQLDSGSVLTRQGTPVSPIAPVTFLFDSQRPDVRLSARSHMKTQQEHIPVTIKFVKPVFGFSMSHLSISGGQMQGFREISKSIYSVIVQPTEDTILLHVPENVTTDVAGNTNLQSNILQLSHYSVPAASMALSCSTTAAFVLTAVVATLLTISTASLQNYGAFATPSPLLTSSPARILFRIVCHIQIFALSRWLAVPLPIEYSEFAKGLRWSIPYFRLPWETGYVKPVWPMNPHSYGSRINDSGPDNHKQVKVTSLDKPDPIYGLPLTAMEYRSFFESKNTMPEAEYVTDLNDSHGWRDFNRSMFWLAVICGGLIILHILFILILKLRKKKEKESSTIASVIFPRFEVFLVILAVPCVSAASASLLKGGSASGIAVGVLLLGTVIFLILALFMFLSIGISSGKLLLYKEIHHEDQKMHWYQTLIKVTLGPGKRGQWTWINTSNSKWLTILGPLFEDLRGPPKYMLSQIVGGLGYDTNRGSIIASDDENEDAEAPFVQKVFGILRIYYIFLESIKRVVLGILVGTFSRSGYSETPTKTLICVTSFQLFFMVLKKPFIKKKVQLVEIISVSSQLAIFVTCLVLLRKNLSTHDQTKVGIAMLCMFLVAFIAQILNEWNSLICQIKQLDPDNKSLCMGLKIASWGILLLFVPIKLMKNIESQFPLKARMREDTLGAVPVGRFRNLGTPDRPWTKQLRDLAKSSFSRESSGNGRTPTDPSSSNTKWSGFWGKRSGSSSQATSMDSKSKPKGMYKDFEAIFGSK